MCSLIPGQKIKIIFLRMCFKIPQANPLQLIDYITPCLGANSRLNSKQVKPIFLKFQYFCWARLCLEHTPHPWVVSPTRPSFLSMISQVAQRTTRPNPAIVYMQLYIVYMLYRQCTYLYLVGTWVTLKIESSNLIIENS